MAEIAFDRNSMAQWYAKEHLKTDPGVQAIYYLPTNAPEREIRLLEINNMIGVLNDEALEPLDFGVDRDMESKHKLLVLDVTPSQWDKIQESSLPLPQDWSLEGSISY